MELVLFRFSFFMYRYRESSNLGEKYFESNNFYESYICLKEMDRSFFSIYKV